MSDDRQNAGLHPTDEPDGTPAYAASLRGPGDSIVGGDEDSGITEESDSADRGGYDAAAVSGDSDAYRPD